MLDIRAIHCPSPLPEVDFASVTLTVRLKNYADEPGEVTGTFRVYNDTTGLLIHTSGIAPVTIAAGVTVDVDALTDFDPPAPADDVYFVLFDGTARNELVPDGIGIRRGPFYFDVKAIGMGPAPAAHHATHEDGGSDEVDCTGLAGTGASAHAASHEKAGADELEVADLATAELDDTLVLAPDGAGGVEFRAPAAAGASPATFELFSADGTWTKPVGAKLVYVECVGAGGGGGGGGANNAAASCGGTGGGGGALTTARIPADALAATVAVTVGTAGAGGAGASSSPAQGVNGSVGGNSTFGTFLTAFGGGPGSKGYIAANWYGLGGGGGGSASAGANYTGGLPGASTLTAVGGTGALGNNGNDAGGGGKAEFGGAGGGGTFGAVGAVGRGGSSLYGAPGGGCGGWGGNQGSACAGEQGGNIKSYTSGGGAAGGAVGLAGSNGTGGDGYTSKGTGGGGGGGNNAGAAGNGGSGGAPGAGAGGGGGGTTTGGTGGTGGRGEVRVWVWF